MADDADLSTAFDELTKEMEDFLSPLRSTRYVTAPPCPHCCLSPVRPSSSGAPVTLGCGCRPARLSLTMAVRVYK